LTVGRDPKHAVGSLVQLGRHIGERQRPELSTVYRLMQQHRASFIARTEASRGAELPQSIKDEFDTLPELRIPAVSIRAWPVVPR
jgi:hypothetical protein